MENRITEASEPFLAVLRQLPFVRTAEIVGLPPDHTADALLVVQTPRGREVLMVEAKRSHLTWAQVPQIEAFAQSAKFPLILFAPYIGEPLGSALEKSGINYVDLNGRCFLNVGADYVAKISPKRRAPLVESREFGVAAYSVMFALLAEPSLVTMPIRQIAHKAGTSTMPVRTTLQRLETEGMVTRSGRRARRLLEPDRLLDRWLGGFADVLKPALTHGRYQTSDSDPAQLEMHVESVSGDTDPWGWTGGAAAMRLTGHYRGELTSVMTQNPPELVRKLRPLPAREGALEILRPPGPLSMQGVRPHTVHPLLVYADLVSAGQERAREAAEELRRRYPQSFP